MLRESRKLESKVPTSIRRLPFQRLVRSIAEKIQRHKQLVNKNLNFRQSEDERPRSKLRFTKEALGVLQLSAEQKLMRFFEDAYLCTIHAKRVTLFNKDLKLVQRLTDKRVL